MVVTIAINLRSPHFDGNYYRLSSSDAIIPFPTTVVQFTQLYFWHRRVFNVLTLFSIPTVIE